MIAGDDCPTCGGVDDLELTRDVFVNARGIEAPRLYDAADRRLSQALIWEMVGLVVAAAAGSAVLGMTLLLTLSTTAMLLGWGLPAMRQRHRLRLVHRARSRALPPVRWSPSLPASAAEVTGVARRLRNTITAPLSREPCLAAAVDVVIRERLAARDLRSTDFLVIDDHDRPTIVAGELWLEPGPPDLTVGTTRADLLVAGKRILPAELWPGGNACETRIREGDRIAVRGRPAMEHHPDLVMGYRDPDVRVLRGERGTPVSVTRLASPDLDE